MNTKTGVLIFSIFLLLWIVGMIGFSGGFDSAGVIIPIILLIFVIAGALAVFICTLILIFAAFKQDTVTGLLFIFVPFYSLYFAFTQYRDSNKGLILTGWLGGSVILSICVFVVYYNAFNEYLSIL
jgi:hypothetical protein